MSFHKNILFGFFVIHLKILQAVVPISLDAETRNSKIEGQLFRPVGSSVTQGLHSLKIIWRKSVIGKSCKWEDGRRLLTPWVEVS